MGRGHAAGAVQGLAAGVGPAVRSLEIPKEKETWGPPSAAALVALLQQMYGEDGWVPSPFEARRWTRDEIAVWAVREEQREAMRARIATLEARVQELEAVVESQRQQLQWLGQEKE